MAEFKTKLFWKRETPDFKYETYDRGHNIAFEGGSSITATAAKEYLGNPKFTNPEELLLAAISSCHMLSFLAIASKAGWVVDSYDDQASAKLAKDSENHMAVTEATLRPKAIFSGKQPTAEDIKKLHDKAHHVCFIANNVKTQITVEL